MPVPNRSSLVASVLDPTLLGGKRKAQRTPAEPPRAPIETAPPVLDFKEVVRANLHAAAQHAMLGHKAPSFRECSNLLCRNASNMVPYPVVLEAGVTDADLEEIFQRVVPAALEKVASSPAPAQAEPEWPDDPKFLA